VVCWGLAFAIWSLWQKSAAHHVHQGIENYQAGDIDGAIIEYDRVIALNPRDATAYYDRGLAKRAKGDLDGALADLNRAIELRPEAEKPYLERNHQAAKGRLGRGAGRF
jgi:tetratricopeptide (TPR) repeat protein